MSSSSKKSNMSDGEGLTGAVTDEGRNRSCVAQAVTGECSKFGAVVGNEGSKWAFKQYFPMGGLLCLLHILS